MGFFAELKRRNVIRVAGVYIVVGWILVQVATAFEESLGLPSWFDGTIVALLLIGLPVALIFAWAFELTPEGVVRTEAVPAGESITTETGRKLDFALSIAIIALIAVIVWQSSTRPQPAATAAVVEEQRSETPNDASVAVLPFADMSAAGDQEYFSDGLTEEILNLLVRADQIDVVSRTSSFQFKGTTLGIPEIAAELNVRHIVEGSVRKAGDTIRVTAERSTCAPSVRPMTWTPMPCSCVHGPCTRRAAILTSLTNCWRRQLTLTQSSRKPGLTRPATSSSCKPMVTRTFRSRNC